MAGSLFQNSYYVANIINAILYGQWFVPRSSVPLSLTYMHTDTRSLLPLLLPASPSRITNHDSQTTNHITATGIVLVLYYMVLRQVCALQKRTAADTFLTCFCTAIVLLNTVYWTTQVYFGQMMWIVHADYPGGSAQFLADNAAVWYETLGTAASVVLNLMSDSLLVRALLYA